jgi:hypothetical protein
MLRKCFLSLATGVRRGILSEERKDEMNDMGII